MKIKEIECVVCGKRCSASEDNWDFSFDFGRDCREIKLHAGDEDFHELLEQKKRVEEIRKNGFEAGMCSRCYDIEIEK